MSSIGTIGQPPTAPASGSGQYWATHPLTNQYSLNNICTLPSETQAQCSLLVQTLMGYFNNPLNSPLMLFPSQYIYYQSNPIIAGMVPHMVHITTWFTLIGPAWNYLRAGDPLQKAMLTHIARTAMTLIHSARAINYPTFQPEAGQSKNIIVNSANIHIQAANSPLVLSAQESWIIDGILNILIEFKVFTLHHPVLAEFGFSEGNSRMVYQKTHSGPGSNHVNSWDFAHLAFKNGNNVWVLFRNGLALTPTIDFIITHPNLLYQRVSETCKIHPQLQETLNRVPSLASNLPLSAVELGFIWVS